MISCEDFFKAVPVNLPAIKAALDRHRETQDQLAEERSFQAIRTRIKVLNKSGKKINYQRCTIWGTTQDQLVKEVVKKTYAQARAIQHLVRRTGAMRTFIRHRLVKSQREMKTAGAGEDVAAQEADQGEEEDEEERTREKLKISVRGEQAHDRKVTITPVTPVEMTVPATKNGPSLLRFK
jgi:hypothetical protein